MKKETYGIFAAPLIPTVIQMIRGEAFISTYLWFLFITVLGYFTYTYLLKRFIKTDNVYTKSFGIGAGTVVSLFGLALLLVTVLASVFSNYVGEADLPITIGNFATLLTVSTILPIIANGLYVTAGFIGFYWVKMLMKK